MSLPSRILRTCHVCKTQSTQTTLLSTNMFGAPDLDLRPPEMKRSTMHWWTQKCPHCGYVAYDLGKSTGVTAEWLQREEYKTCSGILFPDGLAEQFYRLYLISLEEGKTKQAFNAIHYAAWVCDDHDDQENAARCRKLAIEQMEKIIAATGGDETMLVQKADLLRRAGLFDKLREEYSDLRLSEQLLNDIIAFQLEKAKQKDVGCYQVSHVLQRK